MTEQAKNEKDPDLMTPSERKTWFQEEAARLKLNKTVASKKRAITRRLEAQLMECRVSAAELVNILLEVAEPDNEEIPLQLSRRDQLMRVCATSDLQEKELEIEPDDKEKVRASIRLLTNLHLTNLELSHIMWPRTAMRNEAMRERAKMILVSACLQLQDSLLLQECQHTQTPTDKNDLPS
jgi:hypothetical protein